MKIFDRKKSPVRFLRAGLEHDFRLSFPGAMLGWFLIGLLFFACTPHALCPPGPRPRNPNRGLSGRKLAHPPENCAALAQHLKILDTTGDCQNG